MPDSDEQLYGMVKPSAEMQRNRLLRVTNEWHLTEGGRSVTVCGLEREPGGWFVTARGVVSGEWARSQDDVCEMCRGRIPWVKELAIGPFEFKFWGADGDGVIEVYLEGERQDQRIGVTRDQWLAFVAGATL